MKTEPTNTASSKISLWAGIRTVFLHELRQRIFNLSTAIFLAGILFFLSVCIFLVGDFLDTNLATLSLQWQFLPWISAVFFACSSNAKFPGEKPWGYWLDPLIPNSSIFNRSRQMACWINVNSLRIGPHFSIFNNSYVNWHTGFWDFSVRVPRSLSCPIVTLLNSVTLIGNM